ncbi:hypothetical protein ACKWTF_011724 [Chironomus riparius]
MIHDVILSLISEKESHVIKELLTLEISSNFIHPAEMKSLNDIMKITGQYREIKKFITSYSIYSNELHQLDLENEHPNPQNGFYIRKFADGIEKVLEKYHQSVVELEKKFLRKPSTSLMFIFHEVETFRPLFEFLMRLINGVRTQKLHGCQILEYLEDNSMHGNESIKEALQAIQKSVYSIFIQQLCQWLNGKFLDIYGEFFIMHVDPLDMPEKRPTFSTQTSISTFQSSEQSINTELWRYEVNFDMLPHYFPKSWAEKVLFIGQTVLMLSSNDSDQNIYDGKEYQFFQKFHHFQDANKLTVINFERTIDEIKMCVTEHLSEIAIQDADLVKQLKLIKDFYLLGRGELFYEFIKGLDPIYGNVVTENAVRDINRIFQVSAASVNVQDDVDLFHFEMLKTDMESFSYENKGLFQFLTLRYKIKWPLHLMFPPKVLDKYNELFQFLIRIRKIQFSLHCLWCYHREKKIEKSSEVLNFRNKLMFLIDNLQYYLQVDVLESQFSIMMDKIKETKDFEQILRAHSCFQANVLSLCFLLENSDPLSKSMSNSMMENPVLTILNKILNLIEQFTAFAYIASSPMTSEDKITLDNFDELFSSFVDSLLKMLSGLCSAPLSQLLLRLDFNYWFSTKNLKQH